MCSTPRPKRIVKGRAGVSGSLLSNISSESRGRFANRANVADERRYQIALREKQRNIERKNTTSSKKMVSKKSIKAQNNWSYWLVNASLKEIFYMLFFGKSKQA